MVCSGASNNIDSRNRAHRRDRRNTSGTFSATLGGAHHDRQPRAHRRRRWAARGSKPMSPISTSPSFLPFIDDPDSLAAFAGRGALSIDVRFAPETGKLIDGNFKIDMTGLDLRLEDNYFPIASSIMDINWSPARGPVHAWPTRRSRSARARPISRASSPWGWTRPMARPSASRSRRRTSISSPTTWTRPPSRSRPSNFPAGRRRSMARSASTGSLATKGDARIEATGRVDMLLAGLGFDIAVAGQGSAPTISSALWPYLMGKESRDWFVAECDRRARSPMPAMRFNFPVGTLSRRARRTSRSPRIR